MSYIPAGRYIPGDSILHRMNAPAKLLCFFLLLAAVIMTDSFWGYAVNAAFTLSAVRLAGIDLKTAVHPAVCLWKFLIVIFLMNTVFFETEQPLYSWWIFHISAEGMMQGANVILRVIFLMIFSNILMVTTPPIEMMSGVETILVPLGLLGVPTGDVAMILSAAIQFIPVFMEEADMIKKAQTARGARFESKGIRDRAASVVPLVVPVFLAAFRRADELSVAMEARGYDRAKRRSRRKGTAFRCRDMTALLISCLVCAVQILL